MLERATTCYKQGTRHVQTFSSKLTRSRRLLHSAFWDHGAGDINLPSWWSDFLCKPSCERPSFVQHLTKTARRYVPLALKSSFLLDFLYPPRTLTFAHQILAESPARSRRGHLAHHARRPFASQAVEEHVELEKEHTQHQQKVVESPEEHDQQSEESTAHETDLEARGENENLDLAVAQALRGHEGVSNVTNLVRNEDSTLVRGDSPVNMEALVRQVEWYRRLWSRLQETPAFYADVDSLTDQAFEDLYYEVSTIDRLASSLAGNYFRHLRETLSTAEFVTWTPTDFARIIKAWYLFAEEDPARTGLNKAKWRRTQAIYYFQQALDHDKESLAIPALLDIMLSFNDWPLGYSMLNSFQKKFGEDYDGAQFWAVLSEFDTRFLEEKIILASRFFQNKRRLFPYFYAHVERAMKFLVLPVIEHFFERPISIDHDPARFEEIWLAARETNAASHAALRSSVKQLLSPPGTPTQTGLFTATALEHWRKIKHKAGFQHDQETVEKLCTRLQDIHHPGAQEVFVEMRNVFGNPSAEIYRRHLKELAYHGRPAAIHQGLKDFKEIHGTHELEFIFAHLISAHGRRADLPGAKAVFDSVSSEHGLTPNIDCWNAMIGVYARLQDATEALNLVSKMQQEGVQPDTRTFNLVIRALCNSGAIAAAEEFVRHLQDRGQPLNTEMINSLIFAHVRDGNSDEAERLLSQALEADIPGEKTQMWNVVLYSYALQGDMADVYQLHKRMLNEGIPEDAYTYAALVQGVSRTKQPSLALKIIDTVMPKKRLVPTAFHFAIAMRGFFVTKEYELVFEAARQMRKMKVKQDWSTKTLLLRAAISQSLEDSKQQSSFNVIELEKVSLASAEKLLDYLLKEQHVTDLVSHHPLIGTAQQPLPEVYASGYFEQLIRLYGLKRSLDKVAELFDRYLSLTKSTFPGTESSPPIRMLSALIVAHRTDRNFDEVDRCWQLAWDKAKKHACRLGVDPEEEPDGWVQPVKRYFLSLPLYHYLKTLVSAGRFAEVDPLIASFTRAGFALDSKTWNHYVRTLSLNGSVEKAFALTEEHLIDGFPGWPRWSNVHSPGSFLHRKDPSFLNVGRLAPHYRTLVVLAKGYVDLRVALAFSGDRNERLAELQRVAPKTVAAITYMPRIDDEEQLRYLRGRDS